MRIQDSNVETQIIYTICDSASRSLVLSKINGEYFGTDQTKEIYTRITSLIQSGKPAPSSRVLCNDQALSDASRALLSNPNVSALNNEEDIEAAIDILNRYRKARALSEVLGRALETMRQDDPDIEDVVMDLEQTLATCHSGSTKQEMTHITSTDHDKLVNQLKGDLDTPPDDLIPTGFREFDKRTGGFRRKNVIALASTPGGGKSAMAAQMAINQYRMGYNVCFVSYEMDEVEIKTRMLSNIAHVNHGDINLRRLSQMSRARIEKAWSEFITSSGLSNRLTIWCPTRELNIPEIAMEIKPMNYDIIYIDYISLLKQDPKKQMWEVLGDHARAAKLASNNLNAAMVLLAQYDAEQNTLKYSKAIISNAHFVWAWNNTEKERESGIVEIQQLKARNAEVYNFMLQRNFAVMTYSDYSGPPPADIQSSAPAQSSNIPRMPELG